eukprot:tig00000471_g1186.t1
METAIEYLDAQRERSPIPPLPPIVLGADEHAPGPAPAPAAAVATAAGAPAAGAADLDAGEDQRNVSVQALAAELAETSRGRDCWEVEVTRRFFRSWRNLDSALRVPTLKKLRLLVEGRDFRSAVNHAKPLTHVEANLALFETCLPLGWRLLWEEVFGFSERHACWRDKILLWDVCSHDGVQASVEGICRRFRRRQAAVCVLPRPPARPPDANGVRAPRSLPAEERPPTDFLVEEFTLELSALAAVEPPSGVAADGPQEGRAAANPQARPRIEDDVRVLRDVRSLAADTARRALAGRSLASGSDDVSPADRAEILFAARVSLLWTPSLIVAPRLMIRTAGLNLICAAGPVLAVGRSGTGKTSCAIVRLWARYHAYWSLGRGATRLPSGHLRAVFLTMNPSLLAEVRRLFSRLEEGHALLSRPLEGEEPLPPLGRTDDELPDSLAAVSDGSYPLFVTGRKWLQLVDGTLARRFFPRPPGARLVTFELFEEELWPALSSAKGAAKLHLPHPVLVWTEFLSLIQGSAESLGCEEGYLDRDAYLALGRNRSRLDEEQRQAIYELHGAYRDAKRRRNLYDVTDAVHHIYREVALAGYRGPPLHEIIVDEVQDFTQAELALVAAVCGDPGGLFFCGDTCQTIARGLSFRFCDLRSLFHSEVGATGFARCALVSPDHGPIWRLTQNYRSHSEILVCSSIVVDMLELLFHREIDVLPHDTGLRSGPKPTLLPFRNLPDLAASFFGSQAAKCPSPELHLGADQVVIVRGEVLKAPLEKALGRSNILTVEETKGLEFEDVLLFNFFKDSPGGDDRERIAMWREAVREFRARMELRAKASTAIPGSGGPAAPVDFESLERQVRTSVLALASE